MLGALAAVLAGGPARAAGPQVGFGPAQYVDRTYAGGEPVILADAKHGTLIYTSHLGTTHLYRPGLMSPDGMRDFLIPYRNQVVIWTSQDDGKTWQRVDFQGSGFTSDPTRNSGFSDPDLTQDAGGRVYDTGINLANDAVFSSKDGGRSWDKGTAECHDGDRPWLAGGKADEVFMATDPSEDQLNHRVFVSTDGGNTCDPAGVPDFGPVDANTLYTGFGKLYFDHARNRLAEPVLYNDSNAGFTKAIGVSTWKRGDAAFTPHKIADTTMFPQFPSIAIDAADNIYAVWATDPRVPNTTGGCGPANSEHPDWRPAPNEVQMSVSRDFGQTWSTPQAIARPANARVVWPWIAAGDAGKVSVVWYETDKLVDPSCEDSNVSIREATIFGAEDPASMAQTTVDPVGVPIHFGGICQEGTTCVANGHDRRLGDFFTNGLDTDGCVLIASGDTRIKGSSGEELPTSRPLFMRQNAGPSLTGNNDCSKPRTTPGASGGSGSNQQGGSGSAGGAGSGGARSCRDRLAPRSTIIRRRSHLTHRRGVVLVGTARDRNPCTHSRRTLGHVARVVVAVGREVPHGCRFLKRNRRFSARRRCGHPIFLRASSAYSSKAHVTRWSLRRRVHLARGRYQVEIRAVDRAGNVERKRRAARVIRYPRVR